MQATGDPVTDGPLEGSLVLQQSFHFVGQVSEIFNTLCKDVIHL